MSDLLTIGMRGMMAYQYAMMVAGQNTTNFDTPFYSRREVNFAEAMFNNGVNIGDVRRVYSAYLSNNLLKTNSDFNLSDTYFDQLSQIEKLLSDERSNIGTSINEAVKSMRELNNNSGSARSRSDYLNMITILAGRLSATKTQITQRMVNVNQNIQSVVEDANRIAGHIAKLNQDIANIGLGDKSSLLDEREAQIQALAAYVDFDTDVDEATGQISLMIGNGTPIVSGNLASRFTAAADPAHPDKLRLKLTAGTTASTIDVTNLVKSGQIAGLYNTQAMLEEAGHTLGRLSLTIANTMNNQNKLGIDMNGNWGGNIFSDINTTALITNRVIANRNNTGSELMTVSLTDANALTTSDYRLVFDTISHYNLIRLSDSSVVSTGAVGALPQAINADGFTINVASGSIVAGDSFHISPTRGAAEGMKVTLTDPTQLALGWPVNAEPNQQNKGNGLIDVTAIIDPSNSAFSIPQQLDPPIRVEFISPTSYRLVNATTSAVIEGPIAYDPNAGADIFPTPGSYDPGYRISLQGSVATGDSFDITYTTALTSDNRNGLKMESLYQEKLVQGGTLSFLESYNVLISSVALETKSENLNLLSNTALQKQAYAQYQQVSGVSQTEEMQNMTKYHEAYQASAQIIQVAKAVFETILGLRGR